MFSKLRNRFLIVNLVIISCMMLLAFAAIYFITYQNVHRDIEMELNRVTESYLKPDGKMGNGKMGKSGPDGGPHPQDANLSSPPLERSASFQLQTDAKWNITTTNSRFDMDTEFYDSAIAKVSSSS
jgi:two-component system sensor histidine kinase CiaH